ncbi:DUF305 domain-containing protein [Nocardioides bruguierae]|nr:DUF305 domain-containing protein [Nocardioides bruguierae]
MPARTPARSTSTRARAALLVAVLPAAALTACADDGTPEAQFNDADVAFVSGMLPHHTQAIDMVEMSAGRDLRPAVADLMADVEAAQAPEIETMTQWLEMRGVETADDGHAHEHGSEDLADSMMTAQDMADLEDAGDRAFERLWLELMIEHHEGAVAMAETELADVTNPVAQEMAQDIVDSQSAESTLMEGLL